MSPLSPLILQAQTTNWTAYTIPNVCTFSIPNTMEVRSDSSYQGRFVKAMQGSSLYEMICNECDLFFDEATLVLQPVGLNENPFSDEFKKANSSYARIIIKFSYCDFTQDDFEGLTPSELRELDTTWRKECEQDIECLTGFFSDNTGDFKWLPLKVERHSDLVSLVTEYNRPGVGGETHVKEYKFFYDHKYLRITCSYKLNEENKYKGDFEKFIQLLKIENNPKAHKSYSDHDVFNSDEYHVIFKYDKTKYSSTKKFNKTSHCFFKLESNAGLSMLISAWDTEESMDGFSIHDDDVVSEMKQRDKQLLNNIITSCEKVKIGETKALKSVAKNNVYGTMYIYTSYRVFYKDRFYTIDFHIPEEEYNKNNGVVDELIKGLRFN